MTGQGRDPSGASLRPKPRYDPGQDFLILIIVLMCLALSTKLVVEFIEWNKLQTCISAGRNCAPRIQGP